MTLDCPVVRALLPDRLDGLLEPAEAARVDAHLLACAACTAEHARVARLAGLLALPWEVAAPPEDLPVRARAALLARRARVPWLAPALRYAATFAAGVLVTLAVARPAAPEAPAPAPAPGAALAPDRGAAEPAEPVAQSLSPRRIR